MQRNDNSDREVLQEKQNANNIPGPGDYNFDKLNYIRKSQRIIFEKVIHKKAKRFEDSSKSLSPSPGYYKVENDRILSNRIIAIRQTFSKATRKVNQKLSNFDTALANICFFQKQN